MHQHGAYTDALRSQSDTPQSVSEDVGAESFARVEPINRQTPDYADRDRVGRIAPDSAGCSRTPDRSGRDAVISDDLLAVTNDIGSRKTTFVFQSAMAKPIIQLGLAAVEGREVMIAGERNRR